MLQYMNKPSSTFFFPSVVKCSSAETCKRISVSLFIMYLFIYRHTFKNILFIFIFLFDIFIDFFPFLWQSKRNFMLQRGLDRITLRGQLGNLGESPPSVAPCRSWQTLCWPFVMEQGCQIELPFWWLKNTQKTKNIWALKSSRFFFFFF